MNEQNGDALCVWYASDWLIPVCKAFIVRRARTLNSQIKFHYDIYNDFAQILSWWRHQMETFSALVAIYVGKSSVIDEFPVQRPVTRSFNVFFDLCLNKRLSKQSWDWWFDRLPCPLWRHSNAQAIEQQRCQWNSSGYYGKIRRQIYWLFCVKPWKNNQNQTAGKSAEQYVISHANSCLSLVGPWGMIWNVN